MENQDSQLRIGVFNIMADFWNENGLQIEEK